MKNKIFEKNFFYVVQKYEKKENIALFNLIFIIFIICSFAISSLFDAKNKTTSKNKALSPIYSSVKYHNNDFSLQSKKIDFSLEEDSFLISDNLHNILFQLKKDFFFEDEKISKIIELLKGFQNLGKNFLESEALGILDKNKNLIELRIRIDDFRFLKISNSNKINESFEIKKISSETIISDLKNNEKDTQDFDEFESGRKIDNSLIEFVGLNQFGSTNRLFFVEKQISDFNSLKNILTNLNLNKDNVANLINLISQSSNSKKTIKSSEIDFKCLFAMKEDFSASKIKVSYNHDSFAKNAKKELIYFSLNDKSYYLFKKNGSVSYFDTSGKSLHTKKMFGMPLAGAYRISSNFGLRFHPVLRYTRMHNGVDLAIKHGHPVKAPACGTVEFAGRKGGYGNYLVINHGNGYKTGYGHLSRFEKKIRPGKFVEKNQLIAYVGNTGTSSGPHLHYEIIKNNKFIDPLKNNPSFPEKLDKNDLKKFKKLIELVSLKITEQKKLKEYEDLIRTRIEKNKTVNKI